MGAPPFLSVDRTVTDLQGSQLEARNPTAVVSFSAGKDSLATALVAKETLGGSNVRIVMADTGHESEVTMKYAREYIPDALGMDVEFVRADFTSQIAGKRKFVSEKWPALLVNGKPGKWVALGNATDVQPMPDKPDNIFVGHKLGGWVWSPARAPISAGEASEIVERALGVLHPTGVPFLDLCIWKGRFPSRKAQFCTQFLKRYPLDAYMVNLLSMGTRELESWQGVRRDESLNRRDALDREPTPEGWTIVRPIASWSAEQTIAFVLSRGLSLNPLYSMGMGRVGCFPCINCTKDELLQIATRFPWVIDIINEWEIIVGMASKRGFSTLLHHSDGEGGDSEFAYRASNIRTMVAWSKTSRGGKQYDMIRIQPQAECSSIYGLCE